MSLQYIQLENTILVSAEKYFDFLQDDIENLIAPLEEAFNALFGWFKNNRLKGNPYKCHAWVSTNKDSNIKTGHYTIGVIIDVNLNFDDHISDLCKKAVEKYLHYLDSLPL